MMEDAIRWAAQELIKLQREDPKLKQKVRRKEAAEEVLKPYFAKNPGAKIEVEGGAVTATQTPRTVIDNDKVRVLIADEIDKFQKTTMAVSVKVELAPTPPEGA